MYKYLLSLMVLLPISTFAIAQETEDEAEVEEVVTTGIKSSLKDAIDIKRKNVGFLWPLLNQCFLFLILLSLRHL